MKKYYIDIDSKSLNKYGEELCGDNVEIVSTEDSKIIVLSDGLGSGVKANILGTLTSKIAVTMLKGGASIDDTIDTITNTLPECQVRKLAYSTFTIVTIKNDGEVYIVEYDNPPVFFFRNNRECTPMKTSRSVNGKLIYESRFYMCQEDTLVIISDGVMHAGIGGLLNLGWDWNNITKYLTEVLHHENMSKMISNDLIETCRMLYENKPGDDTTVVTLKVKEEEVIYLFTGPPKHKKDDKKLIDIIKSARGKKIICGGTTANIVSRALDAPIKVNLDNYSPDTPPIGYMDGIDLVTEGLLTLNKVNETIREYIKRADTRTILNLNQGSDGASLISSMLINEGTTIKIFMGQAVNPAHQNPDFPMDFNMKLRVVNELTTLLKKLDKKVEITYL